MLQKKLMENKKIEIIWDSVVEDVIGDKEPKNVKGIKIKNLSFTSGVNLVTLTLEGSYDSTTYPFILGDKLFVENIFL